MSDLDPPVTADGPRLPTGTLDRSEPGGAWWRYRHPESSSPAPPEPVRAPDRSQPPPPDETDARATPSLDLRASDVSGAVPFIFGLLGLAALATTSQLEIAGVGTYLVPLTGTFFVWAFARRAKRRHPDEPYLGRWLLYGFVLKLVFSWFRYLTLTVAFGGVGDATGYDRFGKRFAQAWLGVEPSQLGAPAIIAPQLEDLRRTNFIRWFTGVVYYAFGTNMLAGFFIFGLLALIGSYLWYRATVDAVPFTNKRLYLGLILFAPSIAFWPASIGKESLMQLGIGIVAMGTSLILRNRLIVGLLVALPGGWLLWVVRPHLLAIVTVAGGVAYLFGRVRSSAGRSSLLGRVIGAAIIAGIMAFTIGQGADFLGIEDLNLESIQDELDAQTERSAQGGSEIDNAGTTLNPLYLPQGAITVLLRPLPWEAESQLQLYSSTESLALAILILWRFSSVRIGLRKARAVPFLIYAWTLLVLYSITFASFANYGLLVRQRSLVLPALYAIIAIDPRRSAELDEEAAEAEALAEADQEPPAPRYTQEAAT